MSYHIMLSCVPLVISTTMSEVVIALLACQSLHCWPINHVDVFICCHCWPVNHCIAGLSIMLMCLLSLLNAGLSVMLMCSFVVIAGLYTK